MDRKNISATSTRKLVALGLFANLLEWYEFSIYGYLSAVIAQLFFKATIPLVGLIESFTLFALGYLARPFGALFFGFLGDKHGRRTSLRLSLLLMSVPTVLIGLLPTYQAIGYWATALLLLLRLIQGFAAGGEFPVIACYAFEAAHPQRRSLMCGLVASSPSLGNLCGSAVIALLFGLLDQATILDWAWRIPFLLGLPITLVIMAIRQGLAEPLTAAHSMHASTTARHLAVEWRTLLQACIVSALATTTFYMLLIWMPFYLSYFLHIAPAHAHAINTGMLGVDALLIMMVTWLADRVGFQRVMQISLLASLCLVYPVFQWLAHSAALSSVIAALATLLILVAGFKSCVLEALGALMQVARATGMSLSFSLAVGLFGGTVPLVCTWLTDKTGLLTFPALYLMIFGLLALPVILNLKRSSR